MNTREILLSSEDPEIAELITMSALTYTKLNNQITIDKALEDDSVVEKFSEGKADMLILDADRTYGNLSELIRRIREKEGSSGKKILVVYSKTIDKEKIFGSGCDSIMDKREFRRAINNILLC